MTANLRPAWFHEPSSRTRFWATLALIGALAAGSEATASPEDADPAFAHLGIVTLGARGAGDIKVRALSDGRLVASVSTVNIAPGFIMDNEAYATAGVWRLTPDGQPDPTFGQGTGFVPVSSFCAQPCQILDLAASASQVTLVTGQSSPHADRVVRLAGDGSLDTTFGSGGVGAFPDALRDGGILRVAAQQDDGVIVGGWIYDGGDQVVTYRLRPDGNLDSNFASRAFGLKGQLKAIEALPDGRVLLLSDEGLGRLLRDGRPDPEFGGNGVSDALASVTVHGDALAVDGAGRVIVVGTRHYPSIYMEAIDHLVVAALRSDGGIDTTFGDRGTIRVTTDRLSEDAAGTGIAIDDEGRIVAVGYCGDFQYIPFEVVMKRVVVGRLRPDGSPDLRFAPGGSVAFWRGSLSEAWGVATQGNGRIVVAGTAHDRPIYEGKYPTYYPRAALFALRGGETALPRALHQAQAIEFHHSSYGHYFLTTHPAEASVLDAGSQWARTGKQFNVWAAPGDAVAPVCRFWSGQRFAPKSSHFYTPLAEECEFLKAQGVWTFEGNVFGLSLPVGTPGSRICPAGSRPLYRAYNNGASGAPNHRYITDAADLDQLIANGWIMEGEAGTRVFACVPEQT